MPRCLVVLMWLVCQDSSAARRVRGTLALLCARLKRVRRGPLSPTAAAPEPKPRPVLSAPKLLVLVVRDVAAPSHRPVTATKRRKYDRFSFAFLRTTPSVNPAARRRFVVPRSEKQWA